MSPRKALIIEACLFWPLWIMSAIGLCLILVLISPIILISTITNWNKKQ